MTITEHCASCKQEMRKRDREKRVPWIRKRIDGISFAFCSEACLPLSKSKPKGELLKTFSCDKGTIEKVAGEKRLQQTYASGDYFRLRSRNGR